MNTAHMINLNIVMDDQAIQDSAIKQAGLMIANDITAALMSKNIFGEPITDVSKNTKLWEIATKTVEGIISENKEEVINMVVERVAEKIYRSQKMRNALGDLTI